MHTIKVGDVCSAVAISNEDYLTSTVFLYDTPPRMTTTSRGPTVVDDIGGTEVVLVLGIERILEVVWYMVLTVRGKFGWILGEEVCLAAKLTA